MRFASQKFNRFLQQQSHPPPFPANRYSNIAKLLQYAILLVLNFLLLPYFSARLSYRLEYSFTVFRSIVARKPKQNKHCCLTLLVVFSFEKSDNEITRTVQFLPIKIRRIYTILYALISLSYRACLSVVVRTVWHYKRTKYSKYSIISL